MIKLSSRMSTRNIFWDWNGTLLDDTAAALATLNTMLRRRAAPEIEIGFYRDNFAFPVRPFYERIGMVLENENWDDVAREYHDVYSQMPRNLNEEAVPALELAESFGGRMYVLSALRQDLLESELESFGIFGRFAGVCGSDNLDGAGKIDRARRLAASVCGDCVIIGDSLHDAEVAAAIGARCVLCSQGSHSHWRLEKAARTERTLTGAVKAAFE